MLEITHLTVRGDIMRGSCPICRAANTSAFVVTPARNIFYCFAEKKGGSVIDLVARMKGVTEAQAGQQLAQHFGLNGASQGAGKADSNAAPSPERDGSRKQSTFDPLEYQKKLQPEHEALDVLGVSPATIRKLGGGYASSGALRGRLALPIHGTEGIKGFFGLTLKGETPELVFPKDFVVPYYFNSQSVTEGTLTLVQDVTALLNAIENGIENIICTLRPITADTLTCLRTLMVEKNCSELVFF